MTNNIPVMDAEIVTQKKQREGDGGTYLVVADNTEEFDVALKYGCFQAQKNRAHVGILCVIEDQDFQHWGAVEHRVMKELRMEAEKYIWSILKTAHDYNGTIPSLYFAEGNRLDALIKTIDESDHIVQLILAGGSDHTVQGPLISYFSGKGLSKLKVPMVIVPQHVKDFS